MLSSSDDLKSVYTEPSFSEYLIRLHGMLMKGKELKKGTKVYKIARKDIICYDHRLPFSLESFVVEMVRKFEVN